MKRDYRVVKSHDEPPDYYIAEVFYGRSGNITGWGSAGPTSYCATKHKLKKELLLQLAALEKPVLYQDGDQLLPKRR